MSIYNSGLFSFDIDPEARKKMLYFGVALVVIIAIALVGFYASDALQPNAIHTQFTKNPVLAGERTTIKVTVTNITKADAQNVPVSLEAKEKAEFDAFPINEKFNGKVSFISVNDSREVEFALNPVGNILPGTYTFAAKTTINGTEYTKEAVLTINGR